MWMTRGCVLGRMSLWVAGAVLMAGCAPVTPRSARGRDLGYSPRARQVMMSQANECCVELEVARHQALHGGGNWRLGRMWPGEWNQMIMKALREAEITAGRMLTRNEILKIVANRMKDYGVPMNFTRGRRR
jgi:hypothetical protein